MAQSRMHLLKIKGRENALLCRCVVAETMRSRMIGLLNHQELLSGEGMLITHCNQVHTLFMRFAIDAVYLSKDFKVVAIKELVPWRISSIVWKSKNVLELPLGTSKNLGLNVGDQIEVHSC